MRLGEIAVLHTLAAFAMAPAGQGDAQVSLRTSPHAQALQLLPFLPTAALN